MATIYNQSLDYTDNFIAFVKNIIIWQECAIYKFFSISNNLNNFRNINVHNSIFIIELCNYLNSGYRAIIYSVDGPKKREQDKNEFWITELQKFIHPEQSFICALNILCIITKTIQDLIDRSRIPISSLDDMTDYLSVELNTILVTLRSSIEINILHLHRSCNGKNIKFCDPNEKMFYVGLYGQPTVSQQHFDLSKYCNINTFL